MSAADDGADGAVHLPTLDAPSETFSGEPPELDWLADALDGRARAVLWRAAPGLVVPLSYRRHATLDAACAASAADGWPVWLRRSGGGAVPQGPGIVNLSLVYPVQGTPGDRAEAVYAHLCGVIGRALASFGIDARAAEVKGSFCDGRFNLAVAGRKIAGTAQYWKRRGERHAVLAHALLLVNADLDGLTERLNRFESALDSPRRYDATVLTSLRRESPGADLGRLPAALAESLHTTLS